MTYIYNYKILTKKQKLGQKIQAIKREQPFGTSCWREKQTPQRAAGFSCAPSKRRSPRERRSAAAAEEEKWRREGSRRSRPAAADAATEGGAQPGEGSAAVGPPPSPPAEASPSPAVAFPPKTSPPPEEDPATALATIEAQCGLGRRRGVIVCPLVVVFGVYDFVVVVGERQCRALCFGIWTLLRLSLLWLVLGSP